MSTDRLPTFLGVGVRKCSTTWISECLRYHPEVFMSSPKEIHFFSNDTLWSRGLDWYSHFFSGSNGHQAVGEFSVSYFSSPDAPKRIKKIIPGAKILVAIRDPIDRFFSRYKKAVRDGDLSHGIGDGFDLRKLREIRKKKPNFLSEGKYHAGLKRYMKLFGKDDVHIMVQEENAIRPKRALADLYDFLEVDSDYLPPITSKKVSPGGVPRLSLLEELRRKVFGTLKRLDPRMINLMRKTRIAELYRRINLRAEIEMNREVVRALRSYYLDSVKEVEEILGRRLSEWQRIYGGEPPALQNG
jgi:hypothetical protein